MWRAAIPHRDGGGGRARGSEVWPVLLEGATRLDPVIAKAASSAATGLGETEWAAQGRAIVATNPARTDDHRAGPAEMRAGRAASKGSLERPRVSAGCTEPSRLGCAGQRVSVGWFMARERMTWRECSSKVRENTCPPVPSATK